MTTILDEINRLKGEKGKPKFSPNFPEKERKLPDDMQKLKIWLVAGGIIVFLVFVAPFMHYLAFGKFPQGFPIQVQNQRVLIQEEITSSHEPGDAIKNTPAALPKVNAKMLKRIKGFTPFYYERNNPPDIEKLTEWGANAVTIIVEDEQGFVLQNKILKENGAMEIPIPALPPPGLDVEKEVEKLILKAHSLGLVVNLAIPVTEKWLKKAEEWKVGMVWVNWESDAWVQDRRMTPEDVNKVNTVLLKEARKHYSGLIGTGFTNLIDRMDPMSKRENPHVKYINVSSFDFITINPHPDPSMNPDKLLNYIEATAKSAREIADRYGIEKVILGAVMVKAKSEGIQGFTNVEGYEYPDEEEKDFYAKMFERTGTILDGYFLDFSGREKRPAVEIISKYYKLK